MKILTEEELRTIDPTTLETDDIKWSNGEEITRDDVVSTYKILQNTEINPLIARTLS